MQSRADPRQAEQHHAEKPRLQKEGRQHLVTHQRPDDRTGLVREHAPVGAELVAHDDARDDAHAERHREDLLPVIEEVEKDDCDRSTSQSAFEHGQVARQPDRNRREDDVKADREGELQPRECQCVDVHGLTTVLPASDKPNPFGHHCPVDSSGRESRMITHIRYDISHACPAALVRVPASRDHRSPPAGQQWKRTR